MKLRRSLSQPEEPIELNLIPLIDIIMFLLIFFVSTTSFMETPGVRVDKPASASAGQSDGSTIIFAVASDGRITFEGKEVGLGGVRPTVKRLCAREPLPVVIQTHERARSGVMVRIVDEAILGGAKDVSLASQKGEENI
ncbi:MAG: biopolymer transporter ExbD [Verrucomicrobia bacterium]|jgi:biopolymer transport protein ExbD|nr:biopolymer transporter ExbD [Verrucomicrobiota bacterium]